MKLSLTTLINSGKKCNGIHIAGTSASKHLWDRIINLHDEFGTLVTLQNPQQISVINAWAAIEMMKAGYKGRIYDGQLIPLLDKFPLGPLIDIDPLVMKKLI